MTQHLKSAAAESVSDGSVAPECQRLRLAAVVSGSARRDSPSLAAMLDTSMGAAVVDFQVVTSSSQATKAARTFAQTADIVVAIGGDGTVADVATGIFGTTAALGIVPAGSTNIIARGLGIPREPARAIGLLAGPHALRRIDVGRSADRVFLHVAGAGIDAALFTATNRDWKQRIGWLAYLPAAIQALSRSLSPADVRISVDDTTFDVRTSLVLVANGGAVIAPGFKLHPSIAVDDGWLDLLVFNATTPFQIAVTLGHAGRQRLDQSPLVTWRRGRSIRVEASPPLPVELDGDPRGATPRDFHIAPAGIAVVTPERPAASN